MSPTKPEKTKVYEGVLHQLKQFIEDKAVKPGDKLPSERELSEQLQVGRSSIREALRALELLGLIETRRGEGTFLKEYKAYHMVELLSTFILNKNRTREELRIAKKMLEKEILFLSLGRLTSSDIEALEECLFPFCESSHDSFFKKMYVLQNQELLLSMWQLISSYLQTVEQSEYTAEWHEEVLRVLEREEKESLLSLFDDTAGEEYPNKTEDGGGP
ncbi:FadR/GntR family transcriptional regulator [Salimicrobium flavidum]|uniref:DNA-binding transcriptional regulator, FadR family n=1 Tax=Salimicrobium flavidum TaxID=570947 RepID=A0A1N7JQY0_9BACI|nr:GntR family transcriptional regulator [Salimicrobium flavidum]SIS51717.1 DNA-binding transcriptional regulator, FadR family [Salimicrobium flavidum]